MVKFALMASADLTKLIGAVGVAYQSADKKSQQAAVQVVGHACAHGDIRPIQALFDALSKSTRKNSFVVFAESHAPVVWAASDKKFVFDKSRADMAFDGDKLSAVLWFDAVKEPAIVSSIDVQAMMDAMFKKIEAAIKKGDVEVKNRKLYDALLDGAASFAGDEPHDDAQLIDETTTNGPSLVS